MFINKVIFYNIRHSFKGRAISFSGKRNSRLFKCNLQSYTIFIPSLGIHKKIFIKTKYAKFLKKSFPKYNIFFVNCK